MELKKLSQMIEPVKASRRVSFCRVFRAAILAGEIRAASIAETFKLSTGKQGKEVEDFAIEDSEDFKRWYAVTITRLSSKNRTAPTFDDLKSGRLSFEDAIKATKKRLESARLKAAKKTTRIETVSKSE